MTSVMCHPLWWTAPQRLSFLIAVSDRVECEDRAEDRTMYQALECCMQDVVGSGGSWAALMDSGLVNNLGKYRKYNVNSLRDLLRVIRNKHNHFRELPLELQKKVGPLPNGFLTYFAGRYPGLLMTCYYFTLKWCSSDPVFQPYFSESSARLLELMAPAAVQQPLLLAVASSTQQAEEAVDMAAEHTDQLQAADSALRAAREAAAAARVASAALEALVPMAGLQQAQQPPASQQQTQQALRPSLQQTQQQLEQQFGSPQGHTWGLLRDLGVPVSVPSTLTTVAAAEATVATPAAVALPPNFGALRLPRHRTSPGLVMEPSLPEQDLAPVGVVHDGSCSMALFPVRPGQPVCDFFQKTGHCKFGASCKFHHPLEFAVPLNAAGLPLRPGQSRCTFFERTGACKFGAACKFDHSP